jgi:hypothetical protein
MHVSYYKGIAGLNHIPIIATDGIALDMLQKISLFKTLNLPSWDNVAAKSANFKWKMVRNKSQ